MRVDLNHSLPLGESERPSADRASASADNSRAAANPVIGEDQAHFSPAHAQAQALSALASRLPEIRQERVSGLRQAVQNGTYHASAENIAAAMISEFALEPTG